MTDRRLSFNERSHQLSTTPFIKNTFWREPPKKLVRLKVTIIDIFDSNELVTNFFDFSFESYFLVSKSSDIVINFPQKCS
jgi:hypothetical protein